MRRTAATVLVVLASVLLFAAAVAGYARLAVIDSGQFADRAAATLQDPAVRTLIGDEVTDRLVVANESSLLAARPIIASAVAGIVGSDAFNGLFRRGVLDVHRAIFQRDQDTVTLTLADIGIVAAEALRTVQPKLAQQVEATGNVPLIREQIGAVSGDLARLGDSVRLLAFVLALLAVAAAVGAVALSDDRRLAVSRLGIGAVAVGAAIVVLYTVGRAVALGFVADPEDRKAAGAVWNSFLGDLRTLGWVLMAAGAVVAAAAASLIHPIELEGRLRAAWRIATTEPHRTRWRVLRGLALIAVGVLVIAEPLGTVQLVVTLAGVYLLYAGLEVLLRLVYRPAPPGEEAEEARRLPRVAVPVIAAVVIAAAFGAFYAGGGATAPAAAVVTTGCNGHEELCDRPLDEIVLPATHNSMSAPLPGWFSAEQDGPISAQLAEGVRGLLIDAHYGIKLANGKVRTDYESPAALREALKVDSLSDEMVEAAFRLRDRLGFSGSGERGMYLCHTFCELGATPLASVLTDIREFLVTHPSDVVVVINQDYVTPADFVRAVGDAKLTPYVFQPPASGRWPTLREMVDANHRIVFLAENHAGAAPWYQLAYQRLTEETEFKFPRASLLTNPAKLDASCSANRGPEGAPLFLINHWVSTDPVPERDDADKVNAYEPLLDRARTCEKLRDDLPNLLAVNFSQHGDLYRVVDTLNRVGGT